MYWTNFQLVPEENKDEVYHAARKKNTKAARKCRTKKKKVDQMRVQIIKMQMEVIEELEETVKLLKRKKELYLEYLAGMGQDAQRRKGEAASKQGH